MRVSTSDTHVRGDSPSRYDSQMSNAANLISLAVTLFFGVLSVVFYRRSRRWRELTFTYSEDELQTRGHPDVLITFRGQDIERLRRLSVVLWNSGHQAIRSSDLPQRTWPTVKAQDGVRILSSVLRAAWPACMSLRETADEVRVEFEYMNPRQFAWIEILYDTLPGVAIGARPPFEFRADVIDAHETRVRQQSPTLIRYAKPLSFIAAFILCATIVAGVLLATDAELRGWQQILIIGVYAVIGSVWVGWWIVTAFDFGAGAPVMFGPNPSMILGASSGTMQLDVAPSRERSTTEDVTQP